MSEKFSNKNEHLDVILDLKGIDVMVKLEKLIEHADEDGFIRAGDVFGIFNMQTQYGSYLFRGYEKTDLSPGLNYVKDKITYHQDKIHRDDVKIMAKRLSEHLRKEF